MFAQPVWPSKQPMNAGRSGTTASSWRSIRHAAGERHVQPAPAEHPGRRAVGGSVHRDRRLDRGDGGEPEQVDAVELVGALAHVDVGVVEAGRHQATARLDDLGREVHANRGGRRRGARSRRSARLARRSRPGLRPGSPAMKRPAADDQQVGGVAHEVTDGGRRQPGREARLKSP